MCHTTLLDAKFHAFLLRIDEDLAAETRARGCRRCGRRLHRDRYPRKPRGGPRNEAYRHRLSSRLLTEWLEKSNKRKEAAVQMHSKRTAGAHANDVLRARVSELKRRI